MRRIIQALKLVSLGLVATAALAQAPPSGLGADQLRQRVDRLDVLGSALYMAAHPDDENTAMIAWLAQGRLARTAYLSMTRGDGGQNLIGTEQGIDLGILRTQELLAARRIDGGRQLFSRAIDFGYTKSVEETLDRWGHEEVLGDAVRVFREFRPDVVITRFPGDGRGRHGQHTASAVLATEALAAAANPELYAEQGLAPWQAKRVMWNAYRIDPATHDSDELGPLLEVDLGAWNPVLGESYLEISARARSMHKCQGFGSSPRFGSYPNHLLLLAGEPAERDLFDGIDTTWNRVEGSEKVAAQVRRVREKLDATRPEAVLPELLELRRELRQLAETSDSYWPTWKIEEVDELIAAIAGLHLDATAEAPRVTAGSDAKVKISAVSRAGLGLVLEEIDLGGQIEKTSRKLEANQSNEWELTIPIDEQTEPTRPHWLRREPSADAYRPVHAADVPLPIGEAALVARVTLSLENEELHWDLPVVHRWTDPVLGARHERVVVTPPVVALLEDSVIVFPDHAARDLVVIVRARQDGISGEAQPDLPMGWTSEPASRAFAMTADGDETALSFRITPPERASQGDLVMRMRTSAGSFSTSETRVEYDHFPPQVDFPAARTRLVRVELERRGDRIGYVMGTGDEVPDALRQVGFKVELLSDEALATSELAAFDAIVVGIRAFNTRDRVAGLRGRLFDYVEQGGTLVVQYNTAHALITEEIGPYPIALSRGRVTREQAPAELIAPDHPALASPNRITEDDFDGWVQERGLYFPGTWDDRYAPIVSWSDPGEDPLLGSLLVAEHGRGIYVYTGISFFRQLPAGVPGAYRLFVNLVSARNGGA